MASKTLNLEALEQVVLRELQRQGVGFAQVKADNNFGGSELHIIVETMTESQLNPKYVETTRISNQLTGPKNEAIEAVLLRAKSVKVLRIAAQSQQEQEKLYALQREIWVATTRLESIFARIDTVALWARGDEAGDFLREL